MVDRIGPPLPQHLAQLTPRHRDGPQIQGILTGPFGDVIVCLVRTALFVLEPLAPHPQPGGEVVKFFVPVGNQVRPAIVNRTQPGRLPPVVDVHGHG